MCLSPSPNVDLEPTTLVSVVERIKIAQVFACS